MAQALGHLGQGNAKVDPPKEGWRAAARELTHLFASNGFRDIKVEIYSELAFAPWTMMVDKQGPAVAVYTSVRERLEECVGRRPGAVLTMLVLFCPGGDEGEVKPTVVVGVKPGTVGKWKELGEEMEGDPAECFGFQGESS